ncbi:MAG: toxic anion resistance protein [Clostridia bacterium]|nr:toxic anion resistance protein [Clostridia bacterium]
MADVDVKDLELTKDEVELKVDSMVEEPENLEMPVLTLDDIPDGNETAEELKDEDSFRIENFTEDERKQIEGFAEKIDLHDSNLVVTYGAGAQKRLADFSDSALEHVRNKDLDEVGNLIADLVADLKIDPTEKKGLSGLFHKGANKVEEIKEHYTKVEHSVDEVAEMLQKHQETLLKDIAIEDVLFENNKTYFKELTMYIAAGKIALKKAEEEELPALKAKAAASGLAEDAQEARDFTSMCERFEKKIYDLELTRTICMQNAPQIRLIQTNAITLSDKIHSTIVNTLPLWKNQMVITLGLAHAKEAIKAENMVTETTNQILEKNADLLHTTTNEIATENERGIVDMETLQHVNSELINTLDDLMRIQREGREKRLAAETELANIEDQLKAKMIEMSTTAGAEQA